MPVTLQWLADDDNGLTSFASAQAWRAAMGSAAWGAVGSPQAATVSGDNRSFSFATAALGRLTVSNAANPTFFPYILLVALSNKRIFLISSAIPFSFPRI